MTTVEVYVSYCPTSSTVYGMPLRLAANSTSPATNANLTALDPNSNSTAAPTNSSSSSTLGTPLCNQCPNSAGICCPPTVECDDNDGKCPLYALERSGNTINGYLIAQVMNSTAPVAGRKKMRARVRSKQEEKRHRQEKAVAKSGRDVEIDARIHKKRKAHKKHF
jgi:hypothetical protein